MEFLLLWIDDLDDAIGALRHLAPRILAFLTAATLLVVTGFAFLIAPHTTLVVLATFLSASLVEVGRRRISAVATRSQR